MGLKVGDIVELRSGGPKMTVAAVKADRTFCVWFNSKDNHHEEQKGEFLVETLKVYRPRRPVAAPAPVPEREPAPAAESEPS